MAAEKNKSGDGKAKDAHGALGARIRKFREQAGLSQTGLGEVLGVSYQQVQKYERGASRISVDSLVRLARALGQPVGVFLPGAAAPAEGHVAETRPDYAPLSREEKDLLKAYRDIGDDKVRAAFLATLKAAASRKH